MTTHRGCYLEKRFCNSQKGMAVTQANSEFLQNKRDLRWVTLALPCPLFLSFPSPILFITMFVNSGTRWDKGKQKCKHTIRRSTGLCVCVCMHMCEGWRSPLAVPLLLLLIFLETGFSLALGLWIRYADYALSLGILCDSASPALEFQIHIIYPSFTLVLRRVSVV